MRKLLLVAAAASMLLLATPVPAGAQTPATITLLSFLDPVDVEIDGVVQFPDLHSHEFADLSPFAGQDACIGFRAAGTGEYLFGDFLTSAPQCGSPGDFVVRQELPSTGNWTLATYQVFILKPGSLPIYRVELFENPLPPSSDGSLLVVRPLPRAGYSLTLQVTVDAQVVLTDITDREASLVLLPGTTAALEAVDEPELRVDLQPLVAGTTLVVYVNEWTGPRFGGQRSWWDPWGQVVGPPGLATPARAPARLALPETGSSVAAVLTTLASLAVLAGGLLVGASRSAQRRPVN
jgi:hypothetical protein